MNLRTGLLVFVLLLAGCNPTAPSQPATGFSAAFAKTSCPFSVPAPNREGQDVICGFVNVPEEHARPQGPQIRLRVAILKSTHPNPARDPLVIESGGPGISTIASAPGILSVNQVNLRATRDIVLVEQRGTRYSEPFLFCDELLAFAKDQIAQPLNPAERTARELDTIKTCRDRLVAQGINLKAYNSLENAADIPTVLSALGYERFNFYGISYATLLAQHLMRDYPQRLRSVILDAAVPLELDYISTVPRNAHDAFQRLFEHCASDPTCQTAYPNLEQDFLKRIDDLNAAPQTLRAGSSDVVVSGDTLVWALYQNLNASTTPMLPMWLDAFIQDNDPTLITGLGVQALSQIVTNGMSYSVRCADEVAHAANRPDVSGVHPQVATTLQAAFDIQAACAIWQVAPLPPQARAAVSSDIPTLILSGEFDPLTPPTYSERLAQRFKNSQRYIFPGLGHGAFLKHTCPTAIALSFLDDPARAPDSTCMAGMNVQFMVAMAQIQMTPFEDAEFGIRGVLPSGWGKVQSGLYLMSTAGKTMLLEVSKLPDTPLEAQIASWLPGLGIRQFPASHATRQTPAFTWQLYTFPGTIAGIGEIRADVAIAKTELGIYYIGLYLPPGEYAKLHEEIFLPVVDGLTVLKK